MIYLIMCGGNYTDWETPRQLTPVLGEPVVARTIRLLREAGVSELAITSDDSRFEDFGVPVLRHDNPMTVTGGAVRGCWADAFWPTDDPVCYLMGDVVFSPAAIRTIVKTDTESIRFFASAPPLSPLFIKKWAEPYAFKVRDQARFRAAIDFVKANVNTGIFRRPPIAWELWQVINGRDVREIDYRSVTAINDYTCDIDSPADAAAIETVLRKYGA